MAKKKEEYLVKKERILEAAGDCPNTKRALKKLFPEAFEVVPLELEWLETGECIRHQGRSLMLCHNALVSIGGKDVGDIIYEEDMDAINCVVEEHWKESNGDFTEYKNCIRFSTDRLSQYQLAVLIDETPSEALVLIAGKFKVNVK